jgi:hypothetical protein
MYMGSTPVKLCVRGQTLTITCNKFLFLLARSQQHIAMIPRMFDV